MRSLGTGRGCGLVNFCGDDKTRLSRKKKPHGKLLGQLADDRRVTGPTYPGDERFSDDSCNCPPRPRERRVHNVHRLGRRRHPGDIHNRMHGGTAAHPHLLSMGTSSDAAMVLDGAGRRVVRRVRRVVKRAWRWNPARRGWDHFVKSARGWLKAAPDYRQHHIPPPAPPPSAAHHPHLVRAVSSHVPGHWGWSPVLHKYAWIGGHQDVGAIHPSNYPPAEAKALNQAMRSQLKHTHAHVVWGVNGARSLYIPGHWTWSKAKSAWTYVEPHADQLGHPSTVAYDQIHAPSAAFGIRPPHVAPLEFWPDTSGYLRNAAGQLPHGFPARVQAPSHAVFAQAQGLLSANHIARTTAAAYGHAALDSQRLYNRGGGLFGGAPMTASQLQYLQQHGYNVAPRQP
jgi:hypothetical protein